VHQERALLQAGDHPVELGAGDRVRAGHGTVQRVEHARLVALGLQPADEPGAGVAEPLVVEVDRVLGGQHHAETVRARLLEQREHRLLGGRVRGRREEAEHLVHVEQRAQVVVPGCERVHASTAESSMVTKNIRSASPRWAIEKIDTRGLPAGV
jgi:hypothetical protein